MTARPAYRERGVGNFTWASCFAVSSVPPLTTCLSEQQPFTARTIPPETHSSSLSNQRRSMVRKLNRYRRSQMHYLAGVCPAGLPLTMTRRP